MKDKKYYFEKFIKESNMIFNNKYDYSKFNYVDNMTPSIIICPEHGEFKKSPVNHRKGQGCPICSKIEKEKRKFEKDKEHFFELAKKIHHNKYDYSQSIYKSSREQIKIICPEHGEFYQTPNRHTSGKTGCPICGKIKCAKSNTLTTDEFISKANIIHHNKYDYSKSVYTGGNSPITIICPEHGEFTIKRAGKHISSRKQGCPKCNGVISKGEKEIMNYLKSKNIAYKYNSVLDKNNEYLKNKPYDFILEEYKLIIEFDGEQHYKCKWDMTDKDLEIRKVIDDTKEKLSKIYGYEILRILYNEDIYEKLEEFFSSTTIETK